MYAGSTRFVATRDNLVNIEKIQGIGRAGFDEKRKFRLSRSTLSISPRYRRISYVMLNFS